MKPAKYDLPGVTRGDEWEGFGVLVLVNDAAPPVALALVEIHFRATPGATGAPLASLSSADTDQIEITNAATWTYLVQKQTLALPAGRFYHDVQTTDTAGVVKTYLAGTIKVTQDVTRTS